MKKIALILSIIAFNSNLNAQTGSGNQPATMKWKTIENDHVRIIYPDSTIEAAKRIADLIMYINKNATISVGDKSRKIDLLLNTNNVNANGYVTVVPYKSEFYATAPQSFNIIGSNNWLDELALHEYRHALQFMNAKRGLTKIASIFLGPLGWAYATGISLPDWYMEGDAVLAETILSEAGRGRSASFFENQRALLLNNKKYSYMQARNGSYKKLLPNHYNLGYTLLNYGRNHWEQETWSKILADAGKFKSIIYPFSGAMEKHTGLRSPQLYELAYKELKEQWTKELNEMKLTPTVSISKENSNTVTNYTFPHFLNDGSIICIKNSFKETPHLVKIKDSVEYKLTTIGIVNEPFLSVNNQLVSWTESRKNVRRDQVTYSVIMSYNLETGKKTEVTRKSKLFSPMFSKNGDKIIAVNADVKLKNRIQILDGKNGALLRSLTNSNNDFISYPKWSNDESSIIYLANRNSKIALLKYDLKTDEIVELTPWTSHVINTFQVKENSVYYSASYNGINNIYAVNLNADQKISQISSVKIGVEMPAISPDGATLVMSEMTNMGRKLTQLNIKNATNTLQVNDLQVIQPVNMARFQVKTTEIENNVLNKVTKNEYVEKNYKGILNGIKLSDFKLLSDRRNLVMNVGATNILDHFVANVGGSYNYNEKAFKVTGNVKYAKFFLPLTLEVNDGERTNDIYTFDNKTKLTRTFRQKDISGGIELPLSWIRGNYVSNLNLNANFSNISTMNYKLDKNNEDKGFNFNTMKYNLIYSHNRQRALQNLNSKWSQEFELKYEKSIDKVKAERLFSNINLTAAGFAKNHGLSLRLSGKKELMKNDYLFDDIMFHSRGYSRIMSDVETSMSLDYSLPLFYPDLTIINSLVFLKRIRANVFFDMAYAEQKLSNTKFNQNSYGAELIFDIKACNLLDFGFGLRSSHLLNNDLLHPNLKSKFETFFEINLN